MLAMVPSMEALLYKRSFEAIRALQAYHTPRMTQFMNFLSSVGQGHAYFYIVMVFFVTSHDYEFMYLQGTYFMTQHWINWLKTQIRASRPQFDDPTLTVENETEHCPGEFGNPSGHAILAAMFPTTCLLFAKSRKSAWFREHPILSKLVHAFVSIYIILVCFCRIYLGRHSIDQILLGSMIGFTMAHFSHFCFKPYLFDPVFCPAPDEDFHRTASRSKKAAIYAWLVFFLICVKIVVLYEYVERNSLVPSQWWDVLSKTCPVWKKANIFHYSTMVHTGHMVMVPAFYFWNYIKHRRWALMGHKTLERH